MHVACKNIFIHCYWF